MEVPRVEDVSPERLQEALDLLPSYLRRDPFIQRLYRAWLMEQERLRLAFEMLRDAALPSRASVQNGGMAAWEEVMGIVPTPGSSPAARRVVLDAYLLARDVSQARLWRLVLERLTGITQLEVVKTGRTVQVRLPASAGSTGQAQLERLLRRIVPAHLGTDVAFIGGFIVDVSRVDEEAI